jgi:hypothetical protein
MDGMLSDGTVDACRRGWARGDCAIGATIDRTMQVQNAGHAVFLVPADSVDFADDSSFNRRTGC